MPRREMPLLPAAGSIGSPRQMGSWAMLTAVIVLGLIAVLPIRGDSAAVGYLPAAAQTQPLVKLRVAVDPTYPPMEFEGAQGELQGFDVDLAKELATRLNCELELIVMSWDGITAGLTSGRYDIIISSMNITPERQREVDFVEYARMSQVFVCRPGQGIAVSEAISGKIVAVQADTTSAAFVAKLITGGLRPKEVREFKDATETFAALESGQADVVVTDEPVGLYYALQKPLSFEVTGQAMAAEPIGIALPKGKDELRGRIEKAVAAMEQEGVIDAVSKKWFGTRLGGIEAFSNWLVIQRVLGGMRLTVLLTCISGFFGILLGLAISLVRISPNRWLGWLGLIYVTLFRGTPLLLQIYFIFYALPQLLQIRLDPMTSGVMALSLNSAAYITEIFRAAIQSIELGQMESARALGMSYGQSMRRVILPQTFRRLIPPLVNELAALSKDTSLVSAVALHEMLFVTQRLSAKYLRPGETYFWSAVGYLLIVVTLTTLAGRLEKRLEAQTK